MVRMSLGICNGPVLPRLSFGGIPRIPRAWPHHTRRNILIPFETNQKTLCFKGFVGGVGVHAEAAPKQPKKKKKDDLRRTSILLS